MKKLIFILVPIFMFFNCIFAYGVGKLEANEEKYNTYRGDFEMNFTDVDKDSWYYDYVSTAYLLGIIEGKSKTKFEPYSNMTLAETAKIAACINAKKTESEEQFLIKGKNWYDTYVNYCYEHNIIDNNITFDWNKNATRGEMAYLFSRADIDNNEINTDIYIDDIPDIDENTPYAYEILSLYRKGIAVGNDDSFKFFPNSSIKRCEAAALIARILCDDMRVNIKEKIEILDGPGMVYNDDYYGTDYAKCLNIFNYDNYEYYAVAFLGYGEAGRAKGDYYINKLFAEMTDEEKSKIKNFETEGDEWFLIVPRYKNDILIEYLGENNREDDTVYSGIPFILRCNVSDLYSNVKIKTDYINGLEYSPQVNLADGGIVLNTNVIDITE